MIKLSSQEQPLKNIRRKHCERRHFKWRGIELDLSNDTEKDAKSKHKPSKKIKNWAGLKNRKEFKDGKWVKPVVDKKPQTQS